MNYRLIATDMDGTLLNDKKCISDRNAAAVNKALAAGKHVVFSSGRCIAEMESFFALFPQMRYVICESGAGVYDIKKDTYIFHKTIDPEYVREIFAAVENRQIMIQVMMEGKNVLSRVDLENLERYHMEQYRDNFRQNAFPVEYSPAYCASHDYPAAKICLYHTNTQERIVTRQRLSHLPLSLAYSEATSLEISPEGIDKGVGLSALCRHLNINENDCVVLGDFYNDIPILKKAGLAVAMGNAIPAVKEICQLVVADCNHSGPAEAIEKIL